MWLKPSSSVSILIRQLKLMVTEIVFVPFFAVHFSERIIKSVLTLGFQSQIFEPQYLTNSKKIN
jgi:hypothetical protein